jgi:hypothetical protein
VEDRIEAGAGHREERHGLGEAVDRLPPRLAQQQQDRRDERAGVTDADPPDEVDDVEAPADRDVDAEDADAAEHQVADGVEQHQQQQAADDEANPPGARQPRTQHDGADLVGDRAEGEARADDRRALARRAHPLPSFRSAGFGSRTWLK